MNIFLNQVQEKQNIKRTPVMNSEYAEFIKSEGYTIPSNWVDGKYGDGKDTYPVNYISYKDAQNFCN